jgi:hypothetical protein
MSILLFGEVPEFHLHLSSNESNSSSLSSPSPSPSLSLSWVGKWYFAKNQLNSKEFQYKRVADSVSKSLIDYVSFNTTTTTTSTPKKGRKKIKEKKEKEPQNR